MSQLFICLFVKAHTFFFSSKVFGVHVIYNSMPWSVLLGVCFKGSFPLCALLGLMPLWFASGPSGTAWLMVLTEHLYQQRTRHISGLIQFCKEVTSFTRPISKGKIDVYLFVLIFENWYVLGCILCNVFHDSRAVRTLAEFIIHSSLPCMWQQNYWCQTLRQPGRTRQSK